jgi:D-alanine-D-alanine ligase
MRLKPSGTKCFRSEFPTTFLPFAAPSMRTNRMSRSTLSRNSGALVISISKLRRQAYTGCNPRGLTLARDKALTKKILAYHGLKVPEFAIFAKRRATKRPESLAFPLFVKSLTEEGSAGISGASIVHDDEKLKERVEFIHRTTKSTALAEQFIEGREIYVGVMGNDRVTVLPAWEFSITKKK